MPQVLCPVLVGRDEEARRLRAALAAANRPPLTTVDMNLRELGRTAGEELLSAIEGRPSSGLRRLPCSLVLRESSRPRQIQGQPVSA